MSVMQLVFKLQSISSFIIELQQERLNLLSLFIMDQSVHQIGNIEWSINLRILTRNKLMKDYKLKFVVLHQIFFKGLVREH